MSYRIESEHKLTSDWMLASAFAQIYESKSSAVAIAIEGVDDPAQQEVRVVCVETGEVVWRSTEEDYED